MHTHIALDYTENGKRHVCFQLVTDDKRVAVATASFINGERIRYLAGPSMHEECDAWVKTLKP
jgi:hypothetical protein